MERTAAALRASSPKDLGAFLAKLTNEEASVLIYEWTFWARENQLPPVGNWTHWLLLAGRGFGKTRTGAEWVRNVADLGVRNTRIALVAPTAADARDVMIEGESGILNICPPWNMPIYSPANRKLTWPNGVVAHVYSAETPERLRGPQHSHAWCDELCAWQYPQETWDNLMFGLRLGKKPRTCITTTPKPTKILLDLVASKNVNVVKGTTYDNLSNLASTFRDEIISKYEGTRLGRQELNAEILQDVLGSLWQRDQIEADRVSKIPDLVRIVVAIDPPVTSGDNADECGIIVAGIDKDKNGYVLADLSSQGKTPLEWCRDAVKAYYEWEADRIVAEVNQGGEMIETLLRQVNSKVSYKAVRATRGKVIRAEPVAALYEQHKIKHVGTHPNLEDQMCQFTLDFNKKSMGYSPDRVDSLVWAITELMLEQTNEPNIRML